MSGSRRRGARLAIGAFALLALPIGCAPSPAAAQDGAPGAPGVGGIRVDTLAVHAPGPFAAPPTSPLPESIGPAATGRSDVPFDLRVARRIRSGALRRSPLAGNVATTVEAAAFPGSFLLAGFLYGLGELNDQPGAREVGLRTGQALIAAGAVALVGKVGVGRARPRFSPDDPYQIGFGRGIRGEDFQSFPSAHTAFAFAAATALSAEIDRQEPGSQFWLYPATYAGAAFAGFSRMFHEEHWATDVAVGAAVGVLSGLAVGALPSGR